MASLKSLGYPTESRLVEVANRVITCRRTCILWLCKALAAINKKSDGFNIDDIRIMDLNRRSNITGKTFMQARREVGSPRRFG